MSMENSNDTIGNRTHTLPACSAVPQPTAPPGALITKIKILKSLISVSSTSYVRYLKLDSRAHFTGRQTAHMFGHRKITTISS